MNSSVGGASRARSAIRAGAQEGTRPAGASPATRMLRGICPAGGRGATARGAADRLDAMAGIPAIGRPRDRRTPQLALCAGSRSSPGRAPPPRRSRRPGRASPRRRRAARGVPRSVRPSAARRRARAVAGQGARRPDARARRRARGVEPLVRGAALLLPARRQLPAADAARRRDPRRARGGTLEVREAIHRIALCRASTSAIRAPTRSSRS
jgi:hypothetical protein